jgi:hypothetical protein
MLRATSSYQERAVDRPSPPKDEILPDFSAWLRVFTIRWLFQITQWTLVARCIFVTISDQLTVLTLSRPNLQIEATRPPVNPQDLAGLEACGSVDLFNLTQTENNWQRKKFQVVL